MEPIAAVVADPRLQAAQERFSQSKLCITDTFSWKCRRVADQVVGEIAHSSGRIRGFADSEGAQIGGDAQVHAGISRRASGLVAVGAVVIEIGAGARVE